MAKKTEPQPATTAGLPAAGGSYVADESAGFTRVAGPDDAPPSPRRRGFGEPDPAATAAATTDQPKE